MTPQAEVTLLMLSIVSIMLICGSAIQLWQVVTRLRERKRGRAQRVLRETIAGLEAIRNSIPIR